MNEKSVHPMVTNDRECKVAAEEYKGRMDSYSTYILKWRKNIELSEITHGYIIDGQDIF